MDFGWAAQLVWIAAVIGILGAIWHFKRHKRPPL
jgi:hypothetical protein